MLPFSTNVAPPFEVSQALLIVTLELTCVVHSAEAVPFESLIWAPPANAYAVVEFMTSSGLGTLQLVGDVQVAVNGMSMQAVALETSESVTWIVVTTGVPP